MFKNDACCCCFHDCNMVSRPNSSMIKRRIPGFVTMNTSLENALRLGWSDFDKPEISKMGQNSLSGIIWPTRVLAQHGCFLRGIRFDGRQSIVSKLDLELLQLAELHGKIGEGLHSQMKSHKDKNMKFIHFLQSPNVVRTFDGHVE